MRPTAPENHPGKARGFTLVEMVVVMTITGILVAIVAIFIRGPMAGVIDTARRAELADTADTALRRMRRDIQRALPNSVRITTDDTGTIKIIEFLPTITGGRYCSEVGTFVGGAAVACTPLDFTAVVGSFDYIGPLTGFNAANVAEVAIYNLGIPGADAYNGDNTTIFNNMAGSSINMVARRFPFESPNKRFHLIGTPVSYVCTPAAAGGTLVRVSGYAKQAIQSKTPAGLAGAVSTRLANNVSQCLVDYVQATVDENGLLSITLQLQQNGESVTLTHEIAIHNVP